MYVVSHHRERRAFEKREHESVTTRARDDGFDALARERAPQKRERESKKEKETSRVRSVLMAARESDDDPPPRGKKSVTTKNNIRAREREIRVNIEKRTVGPALATINTVSPLGTALTVPRSHPVTGMMRADEFPRVCEVLFCEEI